MSVYLHNGTKTQTVDAVNKNLVGNVRRWYIEFTKIAVILEPSTTLLHRNKVTNLVGD